MEEMYEVVEKMETYGGSFVKTLARLWMVADPLNRKKLESCFAEYFEEYKKFGGANEKNEKDA